MTALYMKYSDESFIEIWNSSSSMADFIRKLGYNSISGDSSMAVRKRARFLNLSEEHFIKKSPIKRNVENIFIKNSTANQSTLRKWYKKGNYTEYKCSICGQEPNWNGKELSLTLDHINGDNHDDRLENLRWICPNCDRQLDTFGIKNCKKLEKQTNRCVICGKEISKESKYCQSCFGKETSKQTIESQIDRETLKKKIRTNTFEEIAREYNKTSGNAIKKWCKYYNLPFRRTDINNYSDEEWLKV